MAERIVIYLMLALSITCPAFAGTDEFGRERRAMLDEIRSDVEYSRDYLDKSKLAPGVYAAMEKVPRHAFVPPSQRRMAYDNRPLPIGHGQTISQPYIVAVMTDMLHLKPGDKVLEIGTGSGYQAAVLGELADHVYSIEIIPPLAEAAQQRLADLGYRNISVRQGDGYYGWEEHAPFDAIMVTAAASHIPPPLLKQLKPGGVMIIPVGSGFMVQQLVLVNKDENGRLKTKQLLPVSFVPLTGGH